MILLEIANRILKEAIEKGLEPPVDGKREPVDITCADFDGVQYHISNPDPNNRNILQISLQWKAMKDLLQHGANVDLKNFYGPFLQSTPEAGYDVSLKVDLENIPGDKAKFPERISLLKRHILASPFKKTFQEVETGKINPNVISVSYREDEAFYIKSDPERVFVIFSVSFKDPGDQIIAKVFLQEFADARRNISNCPAVTYSREAPLELQGVRGVHESDNHSFVSFVLFKNHINTKNADKTINTIQTFRNYLHYHIKCSKAYLHTRMRLRVDSLLQILNRARPAILETKEKKLASGRTFVRKV